MKIYTKTGDDGTTGLLYGGRVAKNDLRPTAYGDVDETQAAIGLVRVVSQGELHDILLSIEGDLWKVMAELACNPEQTNKLKEADSCVNEEKVTQLEELIDQISERFEMPTDFVLPGENETSARLDLARAIARRAERASVQIGLGEDSQVIPYLNRLSDLLWSLARWQEGTAVTARSIAEQEEK